MPFKILRFLVAILTFLVISLFAAGHLYGLWIWCLTLRAPGTVRRRRAGRWRAFWSDFALRILMRQLGMRLDVRARVEAQEGMRPRTPAVVISNHQSSLDIIILAATLKRLGYRDTRWILKRKLRHRSLYIGHSCIMSGCGFVERGGTPGDIAAVEACAERARSDGAVVVLFPEGKRFDRRRRDARYRHVLPPRQGGFSAIRSKLGQGSHVFSVTLHWPGMRDTKGWLAGALNAVGRRVIVEWERAEASSLSDGWLDEEWLRKDARLDTLDKVA